VRLIIGKGYYDVMEMANCQLVRLDNFDFLPTILSLSKLLL